MQVQDVSPERRNLVILSISIIVFYLAGGELSDDLLKLQVINITFKKPEILMYLVCLSLFWFCFRYWLVMQNSWNKEFSKEVSNNNLSIFYFYFMYKFNLPNDTIKPYFENKHWFGIEFFEYKKIFKISHTYDDSNGKQKRDHKKMASFIDQLIILIYVIYLFFRRPSLSTYYVPYLLFTYAVVLGIFNTLL